MNYGMDHTMLNYNIVATHDMELHYLGADKKHRMFSEVIIRKDIPLDMGEQTQHTFEVNVVFEKKYKLLWLNFWLVCKVIKFENKELCTREMFSWYRQSQVLKAIEELLECSCNKFDFKWGNMLHEIGNDAEEYLKKYYIDVVLDGKEWVDDVFNIVK